MVLTRNKRSQTFDLTESRLRPRSAQMKIYAVEIKSVRETLIDLKDAPRQMRHGIVTQAALDRAEGAGLVRKRVIRGTLIYAATDGSGTVFMPSKAFATASESRDYAAQGRRMLDGWSRRRVVIPTGRMVAAAGGVQVGMGLWLLVDSMSDLAGDVAILTDQNFRNEEALLRGGEHAMGAVAGAALLAQSDSTAIACIAQAEAQISRLTKISRWAGPIGWVALAGIEGFKVWQWTAGYATDRQFYTGQAHFWGGLAGGLAGGWAGFKAGALTGAAIGTLFGPEGTPVGAGIGGFVGAIGGCFGGGYIGARGVGSAVGTYFEFKDREQEAEYVRFLRQHYGLSP
jgi:hypothetical protein